MIGLRTAVDGFFGAALVIVAVETNAVALGLLFAAISPTYAVVLVISGPILTVLSLTGWF